MKSIKFPGANLEIGKGQEDIYNVLHAMILPGPEGELIMCFELTDEEIEQISKNKKIYYSRLTFHQPGFQPMRLMIDLDHGLEIKEE